MKNYYPCLTLLVLFFTAFSGNVLAQSSTYGQQKTLKVEATVSNGKVTINWEAFDPVSSFRVYKMSGGSWPSTPDAVYSNTVFTHVDSSINNNQMYEYKIVGLRSGIDAYGYISVAVNLEENTNKGMVAVLVDSSIYDDLTAELDVYKKDLIGDGYEVTIISYDTNQSAEDLKGDIIGLSNTYSNLTTVFLVGNMPYYYTGEMSPDGHTDHHGAWPSDLMLADVDGSYTDIQVRYTNSTDDRLSNEKNDDKTDQSFLSSDADIQIGRIDFTDLPAFSQSLISLYQNYFEKLHEFKTGEFVPRNIGIVDDNFLSFSEGFSQNGYRNFAPIVGSDSVFDADIITTTTNSSALFSFTAGAGTYTSINGFATTASLASSDLDGVFGMVLGSYNGDPDVQNNLMRAMIANGNFLTASWAGRPNWFIQHMALGKPIGYSTKLTQNNVGLYEPTGLYPRSMHVLLLGDPTLKSHYTKNVGNLYTIRSINKDTAMLSWNSVAGVLGYNVYRSTEENEGYVKVNSSLLTSTSYNDAISPDTSYYYRIEAVELVTSPSGSYYESSTGSYIISDYNAAPVPVTLISFTAEQVEKEVELNWTVAQEINFSHYSVEKYDLEANGWYEIAQVDPCGDGMSITDYQLIDQNPILGKNIYRLKMVDYDQTFEYSNIQVVLFEGGQRYGEFEITPLPARNYIEVQTTFAGDFDSREFAVIAANGREVIRQTITMYNNRIDLRALPAGLYFVQDINQLGETQKLVITD
ncbi:fibronectin type III domain-containing protein [bacterium]|nr:fibronectin type III domain-containing protein [bacterium]